MSAWRRYEILLPLRFNDGSKVPEDALGAVLIELDQRFGAVSWETQIIHGAWQTGGKRYRDDLMRVFVDVPDTAENKTFFLNYKKQVMEAFQQLDIWLTSYTIDVL